MERKIILKSRIITVVGGNVIYSFIIEVVLTKHLCFNARFTFRFKQIIKMKTEVTFLFEKLNL